MNVEIRVNNDTLFALDNILDDIANYPLINQPHEIKVIITAIYGIADKIEKKAKKIKRDNSLFDVNKTTKLTMKYYEANALYDALNYLIQDNHQISGHHQVLLQNQINNLNQKLL